MLSRRNTAPPKEMRVRTIPLRRAKCLFLLLAERSAVFPQLRHTIELFRETGYL